MRKIFKKIVKKVKAALNAQVEMTKAAVDRTWSTLSIMFPRLQDVRGDLATNTIGAIIIAVVVIGLLVIAINAFFPGFFTRMFNAMQDKLNANW